MKLHSTNRQLRVLCAAAAAAPIIALCWDNRHRAQGRAPAAPPSPSGHRRGRRARCHIPRLYFFLVSRSIQCTPNC